MGQLARQRIWQSRGITGNDRLVLLALADMTPDDCYICYPRVQTIADMSGMSDRQAQRIIAKLCEQGKLDVVMGRGRNHTTRYAVLVGLSTEELGEAMFELKGDAAMSPIPTDKGDIKGDKKHDTAMSPFITEKVTYSQEKVTDQALKGDTAMSPEQKEQSKQKDHVLPIAEIVPDLAVASVDAPAAQPEKKKRPAKVEPQSPIEVRQAIAKGSQIDLKAGLQKDIIQVNQAAATIWNKLRTPDQALELVLADIRACGKWVRTSQHPYKGSDQCMPPSALVRFWPAWKEAAAKAKPVYLNGHTNGTHAPTEPQLSLEEQRRRSAEAAKKYPSLKLPGGAP